MLNRIDQSGLSLDQKEGFINWLRERPPMQLSIQNALGKGHPLKALPISKSPTGKGEYIVGVGT